MTATDWERWEGVSGGRWDAVGQEAQNTLVGNQGEASASIVSEKGSH